MNETNLHTVSPRDMKANITPTQPAAAEPATPMNDAWNTAAVAEIIRGQSTPGESPAFLFVGRHEARLLRDHLGAAFGAEAVASLKDLYYMGLEVIEVDMENCLRPAGRKVVRTLQDPMSRRPAWRDRDTDALWHLRIA
jgi:hypothetical protein